MGYALRAEDRDDLRSEVYPGSVEFCDGFGNNCDVAVDEGVTTLYYLDADMDGTVQPLLYVTP